MRSGLPDSAHQGHVTVEQTPRITIIMPTYRHAAFIPQAIESLLAQTLEAWRLVIVDDGSPDDTPARVEPYLTDPRVAYTRLPRNEGLGVALNVGLNMADTDLIAYLPSDDRYFRDHLASLVNCLDRHPEAMMAISGVRHHYNRSAPAAPPGEAPQLIQCAHRRTTERWVERSN